MLVRGDLHAVPQPSSREVPALRHAHLHRGAYACVRRTAGTVGPWHVADLLEGGAAEGFGGHAHGGRQAGGRETGKHRHWHHQEAVEPSRQCCAPLQLPSEVPPADLRAASTAGCSAPTAPRRHPRGAVCPLRGGLHLRAPQGPLGQDAARGDARVRAHPPLACGQPQALGRCAGQAAGGGGAPARGGQAPARGGGAPARGGDAPT
mmetsp:Transcript_59202/g.183853  ORF Transcript_59202/g.183853 Transcript_59202/m.183853 type:complete len:206 (-) Transcript_59202:82-699(-)